MDSSVFLINAPAIVLTMIVINVLQCYLIVRRYLAAVDEKTAKSNNITVKRDSDIVESCITIIRHLLSEDEQLEVVEDDNSIASNNVRDDVDSDGSLNDGSKHHIPEGIQCFLLVVFILIFTFGFFQYFYYFESIRLVRGELLGLEIEDAWNAFSLTMDPNEYVRVASLRSHAIEAAILFLFQCWAYFKLNVVDSQVSIEFQYDNKLLPNMANAFSLIAGLMSLIYLIGLWAN